MAYYNNGDLITQGDQELATIAACVRLVGETAPFFIDDTEKANRLRGFCAQLAGSLAMTYMLTPEDPIDEAPTDRDFSSDDLIGGIHHAIPEFGAVEHTYQGPIATFIVGALRFRAAAAPCDRDEEHDYAQATLMLEQLGS